MAILITFLALLGFTTFYFLRSARHWRALQTLTLKGTVTGIAGLFFVVALLLPEFVMAQDAIFDGVNERLSEARSGFESWVSNIAFIALFGIAAYSVWKQQIPGKWLLTFCAVLVLLGFGQELIEWLNPNAT